VRNLVLIPSLIVLIGIVFIFGLTVGVYKVFPYEILDSSLDAIKEEAPTENNQFITQSDLNTLVRIDGKSDIEKKRNDLTKFFWSVGSLQHSDHITFRPQLPEVESDISDFRYNNFQNLKQIDKLTIEMEYGINSVSYLLLPEESNEKLILYHHGHDGDFLLGKDTIQFFLERNFTVLAMTMPLVGMNNQPTVEIDGIGEMKLISHDQLRFLEKNSFNPMKLFIHPIQVSLNFLEKEYDFKRYSIIGLSGGGWTGIVYSAIDDRISDSFSVASSMPFYLRVDERDIGDYEQTNIDLYKISNYLELYVLAAYGDDRKHIQIFNKDDPCCYSGNGYESYEFFIKDKLVKLGKGSFQILIDDTHNEHKISDTMLEYIRTNIG
jgi:cephalosporin-C deacetylase-like acetyl esterase